jgi:integrase/recombinase XerC
MQDDARATPADIAAYLNWLARERRLARGTVANYARDLARLAALAAGDDAAALDAHRIRSFAAQLHRRGLDGKSIAHALSVWRGFYDWLAAQGRVGGNPARGVRAPKTPKTLPKALSVDDAQALAGFLPDGSDAALRDHAMVELMYSCGLRRAELVSLDVQYLRTPSYESRSWLDLANAEVQVIGKGSKRRAVPVGAKAVQALRAWLAVRERLLRPSSSEDARAALFLGARGERIGASVVHARMVALSRQAGIAAKVHPHVLRHSAASHLLQSSGDLRAVQEFLGHANIGTTQIYTRLDWQHLAKTYDAAHPRARKKA